MNKVYPTSVRSVGVGMAARMGRIGGMISPFVAVGLVGSCHQTAALILFEVVTLLLGFGVLLLKKTYRYNVMILSTLIYLRVQI